MSAMTLFIIVLILGIACQWIGRDYGGVIAFVTQIAGFLMIAFGIYGVITAFV